MQPSILSLHCEGASRSIHINGIYRAHLKPGCSISLRDKWVITRILSLSRAINLEAPSRLTLPFLNITWPTHMNISSKIDESLEYKPLTVNLMDVPTLQGFEKWSDKFTTRSALYGYIIAFICGLLTLVILLILRKLGYLNRCRDFCLKQCPLWNLTSDRSSIESTLEQDPKKSVSKSSEPTVVFQKKGFNSEPTVSFIPTFDLGSSIDHSIRPSEVPEKNILPGPPVYPSLVSEN